MRYKVLANQSLIDIACEIAGNADAVFDLMKANNFIFNLDFATEPQVNNLAEIPAIFENKTKEVADYFVKTKTNIATSESGILIADFNLDFNLDFYS